MFVARLNEHKLWLATTWYRRAFTRKWVRVILIGFTWHKFPPEQNKHASGIFVTHLTFCVFSLPLKTEHFRFNGYHHRTFGQNSKEAHDNVSWRSPYAHSRREGWPHFNIICAATIQSISLAKSIPSKMKSMDFVLCCCSQLVMLQFERGCINLLSLIRYIYLLLA